MTDDLNRTETELYFLYKCQEGLKRKGLFGKKEYMERLDYEYNTIRKMGYCGYFLVVANILDWARKNNIAVGPGRGSGAGAMVSFLLGITALDPIIHELIFERFLNPERVSLPDLDIDIQDDKRDLVVNHIREEYGQDCVCNIGTFGSMKAKAAIRDVCRTLGYDYNTGDKLAGLILPPIEGKVQDLETCYEKVPELTVYKEQVGTIESQILKWAEKLENRIRSFGCHASGICISPDPVWNYLPIYPGKEKQSVSQFEMYTVEEVGLVKFDFLGLKALTTVGRCLELIKKRTREEIDILGIPIDDEKVYREIFCAGDLAGIFQWEGGAGICDLTMRVQPLTLRDLSDICALYRPGPLSSGMAEQYVAVRNLTAAPEYIVPELKPILSKTSGVLIYQEQILEICKQLAGYTLGEADMMRRAIGKKKQEEMDKQKAKFIQGMINNRFTEEVAVKIFEDINTFAGYGFNLSHSLSYSYLSYQMAWLKTYYPVEFLCSCLTTDSNEVEKVIRYIDACRKRDIQILPPDINKSEDGFSIDDKAIRFGFSAIKNVGVGPVKLIREERKNRRFRDLLDFLGREKLSGLNRRQVESLVLAGAFDGLDKYPNRKYMTEIIDAVWEFRGELKKYNNKMETFERKTIAYNQREEEIKAGATKKSFKVPEPPEKPTIPMPKLGQDFLTREKLAKEKELLGYYISGHPLDDVPELNRSGILTIAQIKDLNRGRKVSFIGIISLVKEITTKKKKQKMAFLTLEDKTGSIEAVIAPSYYAEYAYLIDDPSMPVGYKGIADIVENDEAKVVRLRIQEMIMLPSQKQRLAERKIKDIRLEVAPKDAIEVANTIRSNPGNTYEVDFWVKTDNVLFGFGKYRCSKIVEFKK